MERGSVARRSGFRFEATLTRYRVLMASSVPLAAPWNGADKNFARLLVEFDRANRYTVQTGPADAWPADRVLAIRSRKAESMPTATQKLRALAYMARHAPGADLLHVVASLVRPSRWSADALRAWRAASGKPVIHTVPSIGDAPVDQRHFAGDVTVVVSEHTQRLLSARGVQNVVRVYPPLDERRLRPAVEPDQLAGELALGPRAVLYPAHYGPESGIKEMIEAFGRLPADLSDCVLVLACRHHLGQDPEREARQALAWSAAAGIAARVRLVGNFKDMPALIRACAITALVPAKLSGKMDLPLVILEALALGRPVIVADRPPMNEALLGEGGLAAEFGDISGLSAALSRLLCHASLREHLAAQGRAAVMQQCDPAKITERYQQFYDSAVAKRGATLKKGSSRFGNG